MIISNELIKPGKGQAFNRVQLRKLISGKILEKTFKSGLSVKVADIMDVSLTYLYNDGSLTLWNEKPIIVTPPNFVELKVIDTDPGGLKGLATSLLL